MAPPIACSVVECKYLLHRKDVYGELLPPAPSQPAATATSRVERPARPSVTAGKSESEWNFFLHEWGRYTRHTGISDAVVRDELWSCTKSNPGQLAFSEGFFVMTKAELLLKIKDLAVTVLCWTAVMSFQPSADLTVQVCRTSPYRLYNDPISCAMIPIPNS